MPMEHLNEHGQLCQGYYCTKCGQACGMHGHRALSCTHNPVLVRKLYEINDAGSYEQYVFNKLKETDNG